MSVFDLSLLRDRLVELLKLLTAVISEVLVCSREMKQKIEDIIIGRYGLAPTTILAKNENYRPLEE